MSDWARFINAITLLMGPPHGDFPRPAASESAISAGDVRRRAGDKFSPYPDAFHAPADWDEGIMRISPERSDPRPAKVEALDEPHPILVVEDEPDLQKLMTGILRRAGYTVVTAGNGEEALQLLRNGTDPSLIVLDLMMPVMDGFEFRRLQMSDPRLARVPVIVCSASADPEAAATQLGTAGYLAKPYRPRALLDVVKAHCLASESEPECQARGEKTTSRTSGHNLR